MLEDLRKATKIWNPLAGFVSIFPFDSQFYHVLSVEMKVSGEDRPHLVTLATDRSLITYTD